MQSETLKKIDASLCLPHGEQLRILLNGDHITYGEIASLARKKGFFSYNSDRSKTIPILATSLLRPFELVELLEKSTSREQTKKASTEVISLTSEDVNWQRALKDLEQTLKNIFRDNEIPGTKIIQAPEIQFNGKNNASIKYKINRLDYSKDLLGRDLDFEAEITLRQENGELQLEVIGFHTSKETLKFNDKILSAITKNFKSENISQHSEPKKIKFSDFENKNRITFLLRLAKGFQKKQTPGSIIDCNISRNESNAIPENEVEIKWLDNAVKNMAIDGDSLNNIIEPISEKYFDYFYITTVTVKHEFTIGANSGTCTGVYSFQKSRNPEDIDKSRFIYQIDNLQIEERNNLTAKKEANKEILNLMQKTVEKEYKELSKEAVAKT